MNNSNDNDNAETVGKSDARARQCRAIAAKGGKAFTLYTPKTVKRLLKCVSDGLTLKQAAIASGISENTLQSWKHKHPELVPMLEEAREEARRKALATIWEARDNDWRAAESFLKYSFWQDYRSGNQVNVNATATAGVAVAPTLTEEERLKLIAQREKAQHQQLVGAPKVVEAEIVDSRQDVPATEPEGTGQPDAAWEAKHEKLKAQAVEIEKQEAQEKARQAEQMRDAIRIRDLGF